MKLLTQYKTVNVKKQKSHNSEDLLQGERSRSINKINNTFIIIHFVLNERNKSVESISNTE